MRKFKTLLLLATLVALALTASARAASTEPVTTVPRAIFATSPPGDGNRLFIVDRAGYIRVFENGAVQSTPFLDLNSLVEYDGGSERGLAGLAFAPDYATSGRFYVFYTGTTSAGGEFGDTHVDEFTNDNPADDTVDASSRRRIATVTRSPDATNHNGGTLEFAPDGRLFASTGDATHSADAQAPENLNGKILLIDRGPTPGASVFASGLRNPFRFSIDPVYGGMAIGDVGEGSWEEVDYLSAPLRAGANFGWPAFEGFHPFSATPLTGPYTPPIFEYSSASPSNACAVVGGYVVRDPAVTQLYGSYIYGDYCTGQLRATCIANPAVTDRDLGIDVGMLISLGQDGVGRVYTINSDGEISRLLGPGPLTVNCPRPVSAASSGKISRISVAKRQNAVKWGYVTARVRCNDVCSLTGRASFKRRGSRGRLVRARKLGVALPADKTRRLKIRLSKKTRSALRHARHMKHRTTIKVTISDVDGETRTLKSVLSG